MKDLLGGKGAGLAEMTNIGLPVPPGFTITTEVCTDFYDNGRSYPAGLEDEVPRARLRRGGASTGTASATPTNPLLVSVRSGARVSMPGMMDTVLNLGLNDDTVAGPGARDGERALRLRQLPPLHADVRRRRPRPEARGQRGLRPVRGHPRGARSRARRQARHRADGRGPPGAGGRVQGRDLAQHRATTSPRTPGSSSGAPSAPSSAPGRTRAPSPTASINEHPRRLGHRRQRAGDGLRQHGRRLRHRRRLHPRSLDRRRTLLRRVPDERAGRGRRRRHPHAAADRRRPSCNGRPASVARRGDARGATPSSIDTRRRSSATTATCRTSSSPSRRGKLCMLQTRSGKRTGAAAVKIAVDMVTRGCITKEEAILRVEPEPARPAAAPDVRPEGARKRCASHAACRPRPARPSGKVVFNADERRDGRRAARRSSWSASRPHPRTSTACRRRRASSPPAAA